MSFHHSLACVVVNQDRFPIGYAMSGQWTSCDSGLGMPGHLRTEVSIKAHVGRREYRTGTPSNYRVPIPGASRRNSLLVGRSLTKSRMPLLTWTIMARMREKNILAN